MDRRTLAALSLLLLVALTGCSYDTDIYVSPEVEDVDSGDGPGYTLTVTVDVEENDVADLAIADVTLNAYSLDGDRLCSEPYGDISGSATRTVRCQAFPSLLVVDTPDRGREIDVGDRPNRVIKTGSVLYRGRLNGSHRFGYSEYAFRDREHSDPALADERLEPGPEEYLILQCQQWTAQADGATFETVENASWLAWNTTTPTRKRSYKLRVINYTRLRETNRTDRVNLNPQGNTYTGSDIPPRLRGELRDLPNDGSTRRSLSNHTFRPILEALARTDVTTTETILRAMRNVKGAAHTFDDTTIRCWGNPPKYDGAHGSYVNTFVAYNGTTYHIQLRTKTSISGRAFENVTAP